MTAPQTIDLTPTWTALLPAMLEVYRTSDVHSHTRARIVESFQRMAQGADWYAAAVKVPPPAIRPKDDVLDLLDAMRKYGSHFSAPLAKAWQYADAGNHALLWSLFGPMLETYAQFLTPNTESSNAPQRP